MITFLREMLKCHQFSVLLCEAEGQQSEARVPQSAHHGTIKGL